MKKPKNKSKPLAKKIDTAAAAFALRQLSLFPDAKGKRSARAKSLGLDAIPVRSNGNAQSDAAARRTRPRAGGHALMILELIIEHGGLTADEVSEITGLGHQTASARVNGLMNAGRIVDSGTQRKTRSGCRATVWKAAPAAPSAFATTPIAEPALSSASDRH